MSELDEAIRHAEEVAEQNEKDGDYAKKRGFNIYSDECQKCAEEHRQLAEWLKELKRVRELPWLKELKALREQKRPHGKWIKKYNADDPTTACSVCGFDTEDKVYFNFCPNCGSDNRKKEGDEK